MQKRFAAASMRNSLHSCVCCRTSLGFFAYCTHSSHRATVLHAVHRIQAYLHPTCNSCLHFFPSGLFEAVGLHTLSLSHQGALQLQPATSFMQGRGCSTNTTAWIWFTPPCKGAAAAAGAAAARYPSSCPWVTSKPRPQENFTGCDPFQLSVGTCVQSGWNPIYLPLLDSGFTQRFSPEFVSAESKRINSESAVNLCKKNRAAETNEDVILPYMNPHKLIMLLTS